MNTDNKGKISYVLLAINIVPLLFFGIIILLLGNHWFTRAMHAEVETELSYVSSNLITTFDALYSRRLPAGRCGCLLSAI